MRLSKHHLAAALALAAAAALATEREKPAAEAVPAAARRAPASADIELAKLARPPAPAPTSDPFAARNFAPAAKQAQAQAPAPAQAPSAPPLPFRYFGRLTQNGKTEVFVLRGEELISVAPGRKLDRDYRVDAVSASSIAFTYLPLKSRQSLELEEVGG